MAKRLGEVLYWTACLFAALSLLICLYAVNTSPGVRWDGAALFGTFGPPIALYLIGRAIRYVLAGI